MTYICTECNYRTFLDNKTKLCYHNNIEKIINKYPCNIENKGNNSFPNYICIEYYNRIHYFTLVINEKDEMEFVKREGELKNCIEARANTTFINSKYNCTKCLHGSNLFFNKLYGLNICQNIIVNDTAEEKEFPYDLFNKAKERKKVVNGTCEKNYLFSPDGKYCYKCNDELVGIPGCKRECSFSLKRNQTLKCESECKIGYIESSEGVCSSCNDINKGCYECH